MTVIFLFPLALSVFGTLFFLISDEIGIARKALAVGLKGVSVLLQFVPALETHFLVPLAMQLVVCFWVMLFWQTR